MTAIYEKQGKRSIHKHKDLPINDRRKVIERDHLRCVNCDTSLSLNKKNIHSIRKLSIEGGTYHHIIPLIYGGQNNYHNCCLLCTGCHNELHSGKEIKERYFKHYEQFYSSGKLYEMV
jgi:5-methylcytosine-specific restriction endonuclease McrA